MQAPEEGDGFLKKRRGDSINCNQKGFLLFVDNGTKPENLMQPGEFLGALNGLIKEIAKDGHAADRDGAWRLDTDQAPPEGGINTQIQLNNSAGAKGIRNAGGKTSATCVLVQNGATTMPGYNQVLSMAHRMSKERRQGMIIAIIAPPVKTGRWTCGICSHSVHANAKSKPRLCGQRKKPQRGCDWSHSS